MSTIGWGVANASVADWAHYNDIWTSRILNFPVDDVERTIDRLAEKGIRTEVYDQEGLKTDEKGIMNWDGVTMAWFKDPAGNVLSIIREKK